MQQNKKPLKLTFPVLKFLYRVSRIKERKPKPLSRTLTNDEWKEIIKACKTVNIEI